MTALAKRFGLARTTIQRRLKKRWVPPGAGAAQAARRISDTCCIDALTIDCCEAQH